MLYWGEGSKAKPWRGKERVIFTNMDPRAVRIFRRWLLHYMAVKPADIAYDLYIHASADTIVARRYWGKELHVAPAVIRVYFKPSSHSSRRTNIGRVYYGTMRLAVRRSTMLAYRIDGCIQEVIEYCGVV